jgi:hypothetical protein
MPYLYKHWFGLLFFITSHTVAQDKIYFESGSVTCRVLQISTSIVSYTEPGNTANKISVPLDRVAMLFNERGQYLIPKSGERGPDRLLKQIAYFLDSSQAPIEIDRIFTTDSRKLEGDIISEDRRFIYLGSGQVEKRSIAAIIYKNGSHKLMISALKASTILAAFSPERPGTYRVPTTHTASVIDSSANTAAATKNGGSTTSITPAFEELAGKVTREEFIDKSKQKTVKLNEYLKLICERSTSYEDMTKAIDQAVNLFVNENAVVETSSLSRNDVRRHKIRNYLSHIKMVRYDKIEIEWTAVQFVSDVKRGPDGNYHGVVSFEQVFRGYRDGQLVYQDITKKHANVVLKAMEQNFQGNTITVWDVLLSDIGVISTRSI